MANEPYDRRELLTAAGAGAIVAAVGSVASNAAAQAGSDLCYLSATELARLIRMKDVSAREVMAAHLE